MNENNTNMMPPREESGSSMGMIIGAIVILALVALGALYFLKSSGGEIFNEQMNAIETQSTSDDAASIETDLNATNVENVDYDLSEENFTSS